MRREAFFCAALLVCGCDKIDYLELSPDQVIFKQANNEVWMQAKAMSHTGKQTPRAAIGWSVKDPSVAQVDSTGKLKPLKSGHTEVVASHGDTPRRCRWTCSTSRRST